MNETKGTDAPDVGKLIQQFEEAFDQTQDERKDAERDRDYYDNKQLTEGELETLRKRKQPPVISNRIAPKIDALLGHEKRMRADPRAYPRTPKHEQDAQGATDAIRFVADSNRFSAVRSAAAENLFIEGIGAATVTVSMVGGKAEVKITHVPWDRFYRDPHSRLRDFSDAGFKGVVLWMDEDEAHSRFKGKEREIAACYAETEGQTYDDRPAVTWSDTKRKRIRVLQHRFLHKGEWHTAILCKGGYLRDPQVSPYVDEMGVPVCDLIATSAYTDRDNNRYGVARRMISPQDEINKRRSKALHLLNSRAVIADRGAVDNIAQARTEIAKPDGYVEVHNGMRFDVLDAPGLVAGQFQLLQESKNEIDSSGVNPALEGDARAPSGRAQEMLMQAGLAEMGGVFEALKEWSWECYRHVWFRIRQYWTEERWVRVTDDERNLKWVGINAPATDEAGMPVVGPDGQPQLQNQLAELDVDLILEDGPDSVTIQSEQFEELVKLKTADPASIPTKMVIEASSLRNKEAILKHMEEGGIPPEVQQKMQAMQEELQKAQQELQESKRKSAADQQKMAVQAMELEIKQYEAVTARMVALSPAPIMDVPDGWRGDASTPQIPDTQPVMQPMTLGMGTETQQFAPPEMGGEYQGEPIA